MIDIVDKNRRSELMRGIRSRDTKPELKVRKAAHSLGLRFRLHRKDLPGHPDVVFPKYGAVILVHGCFWHRHKGCSKAYSPKSNRIFWQRKFAVNISRDRRVETELKGLGWRILKIWECETHNPIGLRRRIARFFGTRQK